MDILYSQKGAEISVVGAGVESGRFSVDGRYQWGLCNANKDEFDVTDVKNRVFSLLFGLRF